MTVAPDIAITPCARLTLFMPHCLNSYSTAPCMADASVTTGRCFNTYATCRDRVNFRKGVRELKFISRGVFLTGWEPAIHEQYGHVAPQLNIEWNRLWTRERITINLSDDISHVDRKDDDDWRTMRVRKTHNSSWWSRYLTREKHWNRSYALFEVGSISQDRFLADSVHHMVVDNIKQTQGKVMVTLSDGINISAKSNALCPKPSSITLRAAVNDTATTLPVSDVFAKQPKFVSIGSEIMEVTAQDETAPAAKTMTVKRAAGGSEAGMHESDDTVQDCYYVDGGANAGVVGIVRDLLENYASLGEAATVDDDTFNFEDGLFLNLFRLRTIIPKPVGVDKLLAELQESCLFRVWHNSHIRKIQMRSIVGLARDGEHMGYDDNIVDFDSVKFREDPRKSITRVIFFVRPDNFSETSNSDEKWSRVVVDANLAEERDNARGEVVARVIYSRWLTPDLARNAAERLLLSGGQNEVEVEFKVSHSNGAELGENVPFSHRMRTDEFGNQLTETYRILRVQSVGAKTLAIRANKTIYGNLPQGVKYFTWDESDWDGPDVWL